jgi:hypothetical protein
VLSIGKMAARSGEYYIATVPTGVRSTPRLGGVRGVLVPAWARGLQRSGRSDWRG